MQINMETLLAVLIGVLFFSGTYLILSKQLIRVILGLSLITHGANLLLLMSGGLKGGSPPLVSENSSQFTDPLPQALILTAIVINFAITAFLLVLSYQTYKKYQTDDLDLKRRNGNE